jgi:hypothetical protein
MIDEAMTAPSTLLGIVQQARRERRKSFDLPPEEFLSALVKHFVGLRPESRGDAQSIATVLGLMMNPGPNAERIEHAAGLLAAAGFGEVGVEELDRVLRHPAYKGFEQMFLRRRENGQRDPTMERDLYRLRDLAVEAAGVS